MRIAFLKLTDDRHVLEIAHDDGRTEHVECETRSYFLHDLLHYAVEGEAGLQGGFWGSLANRKTLAEMNDRTTAAMGAGESEMAAIERIVGALQSSTKGRTPTQVVDGMRRFAEALEGEMPAWLTEAFVEAVQERMRQLVGQWRATRCSERMELEWPIR